MLRFIERLERRGQRLAPHRRFYRRAGACALVGLAMYLFTLLIGTIGFYIFDGSGWLDAAVNTTMLMSQLGQLTAIERPAMKVFLLGYAPLASIGFFGGIGVLMLPWLHRVIHHFHLDPDEGRRA
jgi:hypothetical protein